MFWEKLSRRCFAANRKYAKDNFFLRYITRKNHSNKSGFLVEFSLTGTLLLIYPEQNSLTRRKSRKTRSDSLMNEKYFSSYIRNLWVFLSSTCEYINNRQKRDECKHTDDDCKFPLM